ncbi:hypothetical protein FHS07_003234 [Microbacterium proteolyticum]|uniref:Uncharacterized protein n=1 Tax=Microbacterium proteolyticum TaxID=1572644 RepID=A0A7W5CM72_9MICO|nr:hypothetical protein [Microbacterium proteolyticum]MBB3159499.1 hypothetical protein [Microbacterium proteolyticum]
MAKMDLTARLKNSAKRAQDVTAQAHLVAVEDLVEPPVTEAQPDSSAPAVELTQPAEPSAVATDEAAGNEATPAQKQVSRRRPAPAEPRRAPARPSTTPDNVAGESVKGLALELPKSLNARLNAHHTQTKMSFVLTVMTAVEVAYPRLQELIDKKLGRHDEPARVSLFAKPTRQRISRDEETERRTIRMSAGGLEVLDGLVEEFAAPSRTFLVIVALDTYLPAQD